MQKLSDEDTVNITFVAPKSWVVKAEEMARKKKVRKSDIYRDAIKKTLKRRG